MKNKLLIIILCLFATSCHHREIFYYGAPTQLPGVIKDMKTPGFWISKIQYPDKILLNENEIKDLNLSIIEKSEALKDIGKFDTTIKNDDIKNKIIELFDYSKNEDLYIVTGENSKKITAKYYKNILKNMDTGNISDKVFVKFGIINHYSNQRYIPTNDQLNDIPGELFFDQIQISGLDVGTPAAVLHESLDKNWFFICSPIATFGWIEKKYINLCNKKEMDSYINPENFIISVEPKTEIFLNKERTNYYDYVKMGTKLPYKVIDNSDIIEILLPSSDENSNFKIISGFVQKNRINFGYIPYTQRNIIEQAFKLLNTPYGWGDMFGEQDCSRFICEIFASFGIILPRNSGDQAKTGNICGEFNEETPVNEKLNVIKEKVLPGVTLLRRNGHIMLYLGLCNDKPYIIHDTWAYSKKLGFKEETILINKVVVTDLFLLGENTKSGSPIEKINVITNILLPD
ncbi:SH3 domain-containing protein [Candidatus Desantisbacteria bacterium]|nr:SH3 domain-containing protein [Candidatus Desantisbacteria bacterium]